MSCCHVECVILFRGVMSVMLSLFHCDAMFSGFILISHTKEVKKVRVMWPGRATENPGVARRNQKPVTF